MMDVNIQIYSQFVQKVLKNGSKIPFTETVQKTIFN